MKIKLLILYNLLFLGLAYSQVPNTSVKQNGRNDTAHIKRTVLVYDTIYDHETSVISYDTINKVIFQSEYNRLYEQILDQKQNHYDSTLTTLQWFTAIFGILMTIIVFIFGLFGFNSIESIRKRLKSDFDSERTEIESKIKLEANRISALRYENEINELKEKISNLERYSEDASNSFMLKEGKETPELRQKIDTPSRTSNPFDKK